jgi:hypothetical protein
MYSNDLQVHPDMDVRMATIGSEQQPLILVDNFVAEPERLIDYAARREDLRTVKGMYPGLRLDTPPSYMALMQASLGEVVGRTFGIGAQDVAAVESFFSMVMMPTTELHPLQRIPHFDGVNPKDIAFLHYLCDEEHGGTSFYRHKASGYEYVNHQRCKPYLNKLQADIDDIGLPEPPQYMNGDTDIFERVASVDAKFNRLIIYRGTSLHSGDIAEDYAFDPHSTTGRLTVTSFLYGHQAVN